MRLVPDTGTIIAVLPPVILANGMPLATSGSICMMVNSVWGFPYPLVIGPTGEHGELLWEGRRWCAWATTFRARPGS